MELISVTKENIGQEHICCAIANDTDCQVAAKKAWLLERFPDGLVFLKGNVRGKCFIEYIPAEHAWAPIEADGYMYIDCLWVSGQYKGHGYANILLNACIEDCRAKGKSGLVIISAEKKKPFLSDPKFLQYKGFEVCDTAAPDYTLMYLAFDTAAEKSQFQSQVKTPHIAEQGFVVYYTHQCPFTAKYVPLLADAAKGKDVPFRAVRFETAEQARHAPAPCTSFSLFYQGELVTSEIVSVKKFEKMMTEKGF